MWEKVQKPSVFNYFLTNKKDELLLFNSLMGTKSFTKVQKCNTNTITEILKQDRIILDSDWKYELKKRGVLVDYDKDEWNCLKYKTLSFISDNLLHLTIFTTGQCNFRCVYCCETFEDEPMDKSTQDKIIKFVQKKLRYCRGVQIDWFGGEPLLNYNGIAYISESIIKICKEWKKGFFATITTNGYLLNAQMIKKLLKLRIYSYTVTIDGTEKTHDQLRYLKNYSKTYKKIIGNLMQIKQEIKSKCFKIIIRTNFTKEMVNDIDEYIFLYSELFNDSRFSFFPKLVMDWGGESVHSIYNNLLSENEFAHICDKFIAAGEIKYFDTYRAFYEFGGCVCSAGQLNGYVIDSRGSLFKCSRIYNKGFRIGWIEQNGDEKINEHKTYEWLNKSFNEEELKKCQNNKCAFTPICMREPCPKRKFDLSSNTEQKCPLEVLNVDKIFELLDLNKMNFQLLESFSQF